MVELSPEKSVRLHCNLATPTRQVAFKDSLDCRTVLLPDRLRVGTELDILLEGSGQTERSIDLGSLVEEPLLLVCDKVVEDFLEQGLVAVCIESKARSSLQGLPQKSRIHPGKSCRNLLATVTVPDKEVSAMQQMVVIVGDLRHLCGQSVELPLQLAGGHLVHTGRKHDGIPRLHVGLEMSRDIKVFAAVESTTILIRISNPLVPARCALERNLLGIELQVQVRETIIHAPGHSVLNFPAFSPCRRILARKGMDVPESQERGQQETHL